MSSLSEDEDVSDISFPSDVSSLSDDVFETSSPPSTPPCYNTGSEGQEDHYVSFGGYTAPAPSPVDDLYAAVRDAAVSSYAPPPPPTHGAPAVTTTVRIYL